MKKIDPVDSAIYKMFLEVLSREKRRRIVNLMANSRGVLKRADIVRTDTLLQEQYGEAYKPEECNKEGKEIYATLEGSFSDEVIHQIWSAACKERWDRKREYSQKPKQEGRDNKGVKVGSGGSNGHKIRWPRKTAGRATWKNFYKLFPHCKGFKTELEMQNAARERIKQMEASGTLPWYLGGTNE